MNEKVVVLFILGMGAVRLYEDYVDEVDRDDDDEEDRFKKRKISRRDANGEPIPPANTFETVVEVQQNRFSGYCQKLEKYHPKSLLSKNVNDMSFSLTLNQPVWVKICRQTMLWGQNLCECRRYLSSWNEVRGNLTLFVNGNDFVI
ncbi:hypothetical protein ACTXT7_000217 [Hymenolepis weldensis]